MIELNLKDCQTDIVKIFDNPTQLIYRIRMCDVITDAFLSHELEIFTLTNNRINFETDRPIEYRFDGKDEKKAYFSTSRYVGFFIHGEHLIRIEPRFGNIIRDHLFVHALGLYLPKGNSGIDNSKVKNLWLIVLLWRANVEKAITKSQISKTYNKIEKNNHFFRGQLNVQKQIRHNSVDLSKFYCTYSQFSYDNTINQTLRYCYRLLNKEYSSILQGFAEHDEMLSDFGVSNNPITLREINKIVYTPMTKYYKPLMELSKAIIGFNSYQNSSNLEQKSGFSVFLDMAEVWENYLYNLLRKELDGFEVENPNLTGDYPLFDDGSRKVRPDILIKKDGKVVAILDAKYKNYTHIGMYANEQDAVSREDLYQMMTYLQRFGDNESTIGIFTSPFCGYEEAKTIQSSKYKIGVVGIDLENFNSDNEEEVIQELKHRELEFINKIKNIIHWNNIGE